MLTRCFCDNTTAAGLGKPSRCRQCYHNKVYAFTVLVLSKNTSLTFYTYPVLGGCQNNSTMGTSPDPLSVREGLACETNKSYTVADPLSVREGLACETNKSYTVETPITDPPNSGLPPDNGPLWMYQQLLP